MYRAQELRRRVLAWAVRLRVNPRLVRIREMTRRWGSCSSAGVVTLAADLAQQDGKSQDFFVVHELLHLRVRNHGRLFQALMGVYVPGWRELGRALQGTPASSSLRAPVLRPARRFSRRHPAR